MEDGPYEITFEAIMSATNGLSPVNLIGQGGQAQVFRGEWKGLQVAVKRVDKHALLGEQGFRRELAALRAVRHENVLRMLGYNEDGDPSGHQYLVMPMMVGGDLSVALPKLQAKGRVRVIKDALCGLQALHGHSILHFDIKPCNILLDAQGSARLADCGLSRPMQQGENATMAAPTQRQVGTVGYIDPEFTRSGAYHRHCDVYSIGVTTLQVLTGRPTPLWSEGSEQVILTDFCEDASEDVMVIVDPLAGWAHHVAEVVLVLGLSCT